MTYSLKEFSGPFWDGVRFECLVAASLRKSGVCVTLASARVRDEEEPNGFGGSWDLSLFRVGEGWRHSLEIKSRNVKFNSVNDYPFRDVLAWAKSKRYRPDALCVVSQLTGAMMFAWRGFPEIIRDQTDARRPGLVYPVVCAPKDAFRDLDTFVSECGWDRSKWGAE